MGVLGFELSYQVRGQDDELALQRMQVAFEKTGEGFEQFGRTFFPKLTPVLEQEIGGQFTAEGRGPNRGGWAELSPAYAEQKAKRYPGAPKLVATGGMRAALTESNSPNALRVEGDANSFQFGTSGLDYASFHQTGEGRMPDRPPFDFTSAFESEVERVAAAAAREVVRGAELDNFVEVSE